MANMTSAEMIKRMEELYKVTILQIGQKPSERGNGRMVDVYTVFDRYGTMFIDGYEYQEMMRWVKSTKGNRSNWKESKSACYESIGRYMIRCAKKLEEAEDLKDIRYWNERLNEYIKDVAELAKKEFE